VSVARPALKLRGGAVTAAAPSSRSVVKPLKLHGGAAGGVDLGLLAAFAGW
jgi:hypothetical protein